jgi:Transcription activator MBF2
MRWKKPTNKSLDIFSPDLKGHNLTHVHIEVIQTSPFGAAEVLDGGIGLNFITIRVNGTNTTRMDFTMQYYGIICAGKT